MNWTLAAALLLATPTPDSVAMADPSLLVLPVQEVRGDAPRWQLSMRVTGPLTTTDPDHVGYSLGVGRSGRYRAGLRYQPSETEALGFMHGRLGVRLVSSQSWTVAVDLEHSHVWSARSLFRSGGFQFEGHDRRWLTMGVVSARMNEGRWLGVVDGFEVGAGRMVVRDMVAGRVGSTALNDAPVLVLKSASPVGMVGVSMSHSLRLGFHGAARVRVIGAGNSPGGVVPFAHVTADWEVMRQIFNSSRYGRGQLGVVGNHASHRRAATYFQNGIGVSLKIAF